MYCSLPLRLRPSVLYGASALLLVLWALGSTPVQAQFRLGASHAGAGHEALTGGSYSLQGSVGQAGTGISGNGQPFYLGTGFWYATRNEQVALPVELANFTAERTDTQVRLAWQTASETNNAGFHVERLTTSGVWDALGFVDGHGTTEAAQRYRFTDTRLPFAADSLRYRLRQVDLDGTATLTDPVVVRIGGGDRLELFAPYPNPARGTATLRYALPTATEARIEVYNVLGQRVAMLDSGPQAAGRVEQTLDTSRLPSGMYFIRLRADGQVQTQRFTVVQ